jgi:hypothetical protein
LEEEFPEQFPYFFPYNTAAPGPYQDNRIIVNTNELSYTMQIGGFNSTPKSLRPYEECDATLNIDCLSTRSAWDTPSFLLDETNSITIRARRNNDTQASSNGWFFNQCNSLNSGGNDETFNHCECTKGYSFLGRGQGLTRVTLSNYNCLQQFQQPPVGQHRTNPLGSIYTCKLFQWFTKHGKGSAMPMTISYSY